MAHHNIAIQKCVKQYATLTSNIRMIWVDEQIDARSIAKVERSPLTKDKSVLVIGAANVPRNLRRTFNALAME